MILHSHSTGFGPTLVILHGLFGSWENWGAQIRKMASDFRVIALDLRNHGASGHDDHVGYDVMADDVLETLASLEVHDYHLLGHSMGGKVAMTISGRHRTAVSPAGLAPVLDKLIIVDIAPRNYAPHHQQILSAMQALDSVSLASRASADRALQSTIPELPVRQFILKNLQPTGAGFRWRLNLPALALGYASLLTMPERDHNPFSQPVLVLRGSESDYVTEDDEALLARRFSNLKVITIEGAGHWPHASHPDQVYSAIHQFLGN